MPTKIPNLIQGIIFQGALLAPLDALTRAYYLAPNDSEVMNMHYHIAGETMDANGERHDEDATCVWIWNMCFDEVPAGSLPPVTEIRVDAHGRERSEPLQAA